MQSFKIYSLKKIYKLYEEGMPYEEWIIKSKTGSAMLELLKKQNFKEIGKVNGEPVLVRNEMAGPYFD